MIDTYLYLLFISATIVMGLIPGPNIAFIVANSIAHGSRYGLASVAGTSSAMIPQLILTTLSTAALLSITVAVFEWVRWIGVLYLLYLGIKHFRTKDNQLKLKESKIAPSLKNLYAKGFFVSITNPKTFLLFYAFLPQFVDAERNVNAQLAVLAVTFVVVLTIMDSGWAILAGKARNFLLKYGRIRHRISGIFYTLAAIGLGLAR
jgi:threonine/homoserine/homoserine lactone efflux protein